VATFLLHRSIFNSVGQKADEDEKKGEKGQNGDSHFFDFVLVI